MDHLCVVPINQCVVPINQCKKYVSHPDPTLKLWKHDLHQVKSVGPRMACSAVSVQPTWILSIDGSIDGSGGTFLYFTFRGLEESGVVCNATAHCTSKGHFIRFQFSNGLDFLLSLIFNEVTLVPCFFNEGNVGLLLT